MSGNDEDAFFSYPTYKPAPSIGRSANLKSYLRRSNGQRNARSVLTITPTINNPSPLSKNLSIEDTNNDAAFFLPELNHSSEIRPKPLDLLNRSLTRMTEEPLPVRAQKRKNEIDIEHMSSNRFMREINTYSIDSRKNTISPSKISKVLLSRNYKGCNRTQLQK